MGTEALSGLNVLICRPPGRGEALEQLLKAEGAQVKHLPTIEIVPSAETQPLRQTFMNLDAFHHVIFISVPAARHGAAWIDRFWPQPPVGIRWYALGASGRRCLRESLGVRPDEVAIPEVGQDSEALLACPALNGDLHHQRVLIVRGNGGREKLAEVLRARGAEVTYAEVYERRCPDYKTEVLVEHLDRFRPELFICLSAQTANNLHRLASSVNFDLSRKSFIMPGWRSIDECSWLRPTQCQVPSSLAEPDIASSIRAWWQTRASKKVGE